MSHRVPALPALLPLPRRRALSIRKADRVPCALELTCYRAFNVFQQSGSPIFLDLLQRWIRLGELVHQTLVFVDELIVGQYGHLLVLVNIQRVPVLESCVVLFLSQLVEFGPLRYLGLVLAEGFGLGLGHELLQVPR